VHWGFYTDIKFLSIPVKMVKFNVALLLRILDSITSIFLAVFLYGLVAEGRRNGPFLCRITL
jgi:hypothetical protein